MGRHVFQKVEGVYQVTLEEEAQWSGHAGCALLDKVIASGTFYHEESGMGFTAWRGGLFCTGTLF